MVCLSPARARVQQVLDPSSREHRNERNDQNQQHVAKHAVDGAAFFRLERTNPAAVDVGQTPLIANALIERRSRSPITLGLLR